MAYDNRQRQHDRKPALPKTDSATSASRFSDIVFVRTEEKPLNPELFNGVAQRMAKLVAWSEDGRQRPENKSTQLRRFYDEIVLWDTRIRQVEPKNQTAKFHEYLPFIRMLNAKAAYANGRKPRLVDDNFVSLLQHTLIKVEDPDSLTTCKLFWEAFMGFYKQERQD